MDLIVFAVYNMTYKLYYVFENLCIPEVCHSFVLLVASCMKYMLSLSTGNVPTFPRGNVWDPYKRLGVSPYAAEEEIWGSHNFLLQQYAGYERSEESIEAAFEKLLMTSFKQRKKTKINLKSRLKKKVEESPPWIQNLLNFCGASSYGNHLQKIIPFCIHGWLEYHEFC
ncbi:hypothetical protein Dsin_018899 [Dipteronia sinensis]|uniref:Uncharacterized protein n=1 Tax=Dipteronia sinensis TaxID=43782 RepID=A0AAE0E2C0_9ROSI|nr:hypothetical protein Dsin_018899 [Dipteronia sinensis]